MRKRLLIPKDIKIRRRLIEFLSKKGYDFFAIKLLIGYHLNYKELKILISPFISRNISGLYYSDQFRNKVIERLLKEMEIEK